MVAKSVEVCPICGGRAERIISGGSGLIFKGSGFYITDYAKTGEKEKKKVGEAKSEDVPKKSDVKEDKSTSTPAKTEKSSASSESKSNSDKT